MSDNMKNNHISVPVWLKTTLTIREAVEYSNIGIPKIENLINVPIVTSFSTLAELFA